MPTELTEQQSLAISKELLLTLIGTFAGRSGGREDDDHPLPPGPWDPVIRIALERSSVYGPRPEPWRGLEAGALGPLREGTLALPAAWRLVLESILARRPEIFDAIGGGPRFGEDVALNPQPLPPRLAFLAALAQTVIGRAELLQEIAQTISLAGEQRGIIIVGGYVSQFCDELCGTSFRLRWPFPGPRPKWFDTELDGMDLIWLAMHFQQAAKEAYRSELRLSLADASTKFVATGLSKLQ